jgi:cytochrome c oxidase subunit 2
MAMLVIAETPSAFDAWLAQQRQPAPPPVSDEARHGLAVVESGPCAMCHAIRGTAAGATMGPDLTHVASRLTLAAAMMPNSPDRLRAWLEDPQKLKPGSKMPDPELSPDELDAVLAYMETLR